MTIIDLERFARIAAEEVLTDVFVGIELVTESPVQRWASLEGGPLVLCFEETTVVLRQPIGQCHVEAIVSPLEEWLRSIQQEYEDAATGVLEIFQTACYRKDYNDTPPTISRIVVFEERESQKIGGLILELSTGGTLGVDASSYGGLVWFLDGQAAIFRRECVDTTRLRERSVFP